MEGIVIQHGANRYLVVEAADGGGLPPVEAASEPWACSLRGRLLKGKRSRLTPVVIGDRVLVEEIGDPNERQGAIGEVRPRANRISRPARTGHTSERGAPEQVVMANVDRLWVVASLSDPPLNVRFIDRLLAATGYQGVAAGLVLNKADLPDTPDPAPLQELYEGLGYPVLLCSATAETGLLPLEEALAGSLSVFVGLSGVGKSSLLRALEPDLEIRIASVGEKHRHGRHTTTNSRVYPLTCGGYLADTPGMREFGLWGMLKANLADGFPEISALTDDCKFRDCLHDSEPGCGPQEALEAGEINEGRYASYRALLAELPATERERDGLP